MKKLFMTLALSGLIALGYAQEAAPPTPAPDPNAADFKWENTTLDFGTINQDADGNREFKFINTGKSPLIISNCRGSCGCTVPTCPTEPILPGSKGSIKVHYDTHRVGPFTKTITVSSNAKNPNETLKITGTVLDPNAGSNSGTVTPAPAPANNSAVKAESKPAPAPAAPAKDTKKQEAKPVKANEKKGGSN